MKERGLDPSVRLRRHPRRPPEVAALTDKLRALAAMSPSQLRGEWQRVHKSPAPRVSTDLLTRGIASILQERALGGVSPSHVRELRRLAGRRGNGGHSADVASAGSPMKASDLRPGTTLMRTWGERSWSVLVTEDGLVFEGRHYASLSKIAREITGAHWSGPRFFGLATGARSRASAYA